MKRDKFWESPRLKPTSMSVPDSKALVLSKLVDSYVEYAYLECCVFHIHSPDEERALKGLGVFRDGQVVEGFCAPITSLEKDILQKYGALPGTCQWSDWPIHTEQLKTYEFELEPKTKTPFYVYDEYGSVWTVYDEYGSVWTTTDITVNVTSPSITNGIFTVST